MICDSIGIDINNVIRFFIFVRDVVLSSYLLTVTIVGYYSTILLKIVQLIVCGMTCLFYSNSHYHINSKPIQYI